MKKICRENGVYFLEKLPSYNQIIKAGNGGRPPGKEDKLSKADAKPLVICDRKLRYREEVKYWLKNYPVYFVSAGEGLKDMEVFPAHINNILKKTKNKKISGFVSLGGGSVGDFTGFLASVYKRGVPLVHIPSTWLSAMDSSHGGKTALNVGRIKNLIGSYCFPKAVFLVKELLSSLPEKEKQSAKGELVKIALIEGGALYKQLLKKPFSELDLWKLLPQAVLAKLKIIRKDPFEKRGYRHSLNLGHTLGHALESYFRIPHGKAVMYGMAFVVQWSHHRFTLSDSFLKEMSFLLGKNREQVVFHLKGIPIKMLCQLLLQDKKRGSAEKINFVFIKAPGKVFTEEFSVQNILKEVKRQITCPF